MSKVKIVPIDKAGSGRDGSLPDYLTVKDITKRLGFGPNVQDDPYKVKYSWGFTINGHECGIWDYKGSRWSVADDDDVMHLVFPEYKSEKC